MTPGIRKKLKQVQTTLMAQWIFNWAAKGLALGAILSIILLIVSKFTPLGLDIVRTSGVVIGSCAFLGAIFACIKPVNTFDAAFACDVKLGLKERITSAIEFAKSADSNPLVPALITDAERHAVKIRPARDFPIRIPREILYSLVLVVIAVGLYFVPPWQYVFASEEDKTEYELVQAEADRMRELANEIQLNLPDERSGLAEEVARELQELARDMDFGTLSRREALERLNALDEMIAESQEESGYNDLQRQLDEAARELALNENLRETAEALNEGDAEQARQALEDLADQLEQGRVPVEDMADIADALESAADSLGDDPDMAGVRDSLSQASDELRSASDSASQSGQMTPEEQAQQLIDAIDAAIPELDSLDVPDEIREQAAEMLEEIRDDLQAALDSGNVTAQDINDARSGIQEVKRMLEQAGADFSGAQQTPEEIAEQLVQEAQRLENLASQAGELDEQTRSDLQSTCENVAQELSDQLSQNSCSQQSNEDARQQLDEVRQQLEDAGVTEDEMGEKTECSGGSCDTPGQGSSSQGSSGGASGMQGLFGSQSGSQGSPSQSGQSGQSGQEGQPGSCGAAGQNLRSAGQCMSQMGPTLNSGQCFNKIKQGLRSSRSCMSGGACSSPGSSGSCSSQSSGSGGGIGGQGWGTGTSSTGGVGSQLTPGLQNTDSYDPNSTPNDLRDYEQIYKPFIASGSNYDVQLEGRFTDQGGSYVFTETVDPDTGETSYVPYFTLEPTDVQALMDSIEDQDIPRSYADFVRLYFEQLAANDNVEVVGE